MVAANIRTIFAQPTGTAARDHVDVVADTLAGQFPAVADLLRQAKTDLPRLRADLPHAHWQKIWPTNPLERLNPEVNAASTSSASSPEPPPCCAWSACLLIEAHEWQDGDRRYLSEQSLACRPHRSRPRYLP